MAAPPRGFGFGSGGPDELRNLLAFMAIMMVFLFGYDYFIAGPQRVAQQRAQVQQQHPAPAPKPPLSRGAALAASARAGLDNTQLDGSIALTGARFDDLSLKGYKQTVAKNSPEVTLLNPMAAKGGYDSFLEWDDPYTNETIAGPRMVWTQANPGAKLTPQTPLILNYTSPDGLAFARTISVDDQNMFTIVDTVRNTGAERRAIRPVSVVRRAGLPSDYIVSGIIMQGMVGVIGVNNFHDMSYPNAQKNVQDKLKGKIAADAPLLEQKGTGGWIGISDHYWLTAVIPPQNEPIDVRYDANQVDSYIDYRATYWGAARPIDPGASVTYTQRLFAGAKRVDVLQGYQKSLGIPDFDKAVDWGNFWILTRPFFWLLDNLAKLVGSFGIAILLTTVVVKLVMFPLMNSSAESMSKMKKIQPKMKELQDRFAADKERQQQELMKLYQQEKINPVAGCLPMLAQIPVFFALYKTLSVTIEMRHAPFFFGLLKDLSARDPTNLFNLFGLLPFDPTAIPLIGGFLWLGILPILYGASMFVTTSLSPQATDPTQQMVFRFMPLMMTFLFAGFAAGLVIYWTWSNILSFAQQYIIMRKNGVETEVDKLIRKYITKSAPA